MDPPTLQVMWNISDWLTSSRAAFLPLTLSERDSMRGSKVRIALVIEADASWTFTDERVLVEKSGMPKLRTDLATSGA